MNTKVFLSILVLFSFLASCNMPEGQITITQPTENKPVPLDANAIATAVELTARARVTEMAGAAVPATPISTAIPTATSTPTTAPVAGACNPTVTAAVNANVRSGPDTAYDIVGALTVGQTATIVGRNDAYTWWYIDYPGVAGNHAWIAGSVVTAACVPAAVQMVAAPALPTGTPTEVVANDNQGGNNLLPLQPINPNVLKALQPDLTIVNMVLSTTTPLVNSSVNVDVKIKNIGNSTASNFTVQWWAGALVACSWPVDAVAAGGTKSFSCTYKFPNVGNYTVKTVVDSGATVTESNEGNNTSQDSVKVNKLMIIPKITLIAP